MKRLSIVFAIIIFAGLVLVYWLLIADLPSPDALITRSSPDATRRSSAWPTAMSRTGISGNPARSTRCVG